MNDYIATLSTAPLIRLAALAGCLVTLTACQSNWYPEVDFGSSVNQSIADQTANKNAPEPVARNTMGMEGPAAKSSIDNYQKSFEASSSGVVYGSGSTGSFIGSGGSSLPSILGK